MPLSAKTTKQANKVIAVKVNLAVASRKRGSDWEMLGGLLVIECWLPSVWFYNIIETIHAIYNLLHV